MDTTDKSREMVPSGVEVKSPDVSSHDESESIYMKHTYQYPIHMLVIRYPYILWADTHPLPYQRCSRKTRLHGESRFQAQR